MKNMFDQYFELITVATILIFTTVNGYNSNNVFIIISALKRAREEDNQ